MNNIAMPTYYKGECFRSKLESKWAAFFDLINWPWEYEPGYLNGYIPDFIINFPYKPMLVEVKPIDYDTLAIDYSAYEKDANSEELHLAMKKIVNSGWENESLIVGVKPSDHHYDPLVGFLRETEWCALGWELGLLFRCAECGEISVRSCDGSFMCRYSGCYDGDHHIGNYNTLDRDWQEASRAVQWMPKRRK